MRGTLRMPNAMVTASNARSGSGSFSALPSMKVTIVEPLLGGALAADRQHLGVDVGDGDARAGAARLGDAERHVAGAAGDVEQRERPAVKGRTFRRRIDRGDQHVLPGAVQAARHQVVHQVVALRHAVEHAVDHRLLVGERHPAEAEIGLFSNAFGHDGPVGRTIARRRVRRYKHRSLQPDGGSLSTDRVKRNARTSRSRNRPPRARARDGGRALRQGARRIAATCAGRCRRISPSASKARRSPAWAGGRNICWPTCRPATCW